MMAESHIFAEREAGDEVSSHACMITNFVTISFYACINIMDVIFVTFNDSILRSDNVFIPFHKQSSASNFI